MLHRAFVYVLFSLTLLAIAIPASAYATNATPANYGFATPIPDPTLAAGIDTYTPPLLGSGFGPAVAEFTRTADPDDIVVFAGASFSTSTVFQFYGQTSAGNAIIVDRTPNLADTVAANVVVPTQLPSWSMYLVWPDNAGTYGLPVAVNHTDAWWLGPATSTMTVGETASVYGRNLSHNNGTTTSYIYIKPTGSYSGQWVTPTAVNPYKVDFTIPSLSPGAYEVWVHNGHGGDFGWSGPLPMTVISTSTFAGQSGNVFNVMSYGATGNGVTDDTAAIQSAINAAGSAAPATVYFPAGTYLVSSGLSLANDVSWLGAASTTSIIKPTLNFATSTSPALVFAVQYEPIDNVQIQNLTLEGSGNLSVYLLQYESQANLELTNSIFNWMGQPSSGFNLGGTNNVNITGNTFIGNGVFLNNASNVQVNNNTFRLTDEASGALYSWGGWNLSITNNYASDYQPGTTTLAGSGTGRFLVAQSHPDANHYFYVGNNTTYDMAPITNVGDANEGEQMLLETGGFPFSESPTGETGTTATFADPPPIYGTEYYEEPLNIRYAMITAGTGTGQTRYVTNVSGDTITVSPAWSVEPDSTSVIGVGPGAFNMAFYDNTLDGKTNYPTYTTASVGIQMYGDNSSIIFANNTLTNMNGGISDEFSVVPSSAAPFTSANFFNLVANNSLNGSNWGFGQDTSFLLGNQNPITLGHLGNSYRSNTLTNILDIGIHLAPDYQGYTGGNFDQNVFEHDSITNVPLATALTFAGYASTSTVATIFSNFLLYDDTFALGTAAYSGSAAFSILGSTTNFWCVGDAWTGFASGSTCTGSVPLAILVQSGLGGFVQFLGHLHLFGGLRLP